ncbi:cofilin [Phyllosticta capitalensis]|uniref:Cofilin n=1 Tax=Phyllosticta capitalensis TaxID=121624 RepID=A0ABR1Z361_9PEZI
MSNSSGIKVNSECVSTFNDDFKLGKKLRWIVYKIADNKKEIVVEETKEKATKEKPTKEELEDEWKVFRDFLLSAGPRYAVYDFSYKDTKTGYGEGWKSKIVFVTWIPDTLPPLHKMPYSASKEALKNSLQGLGAYIQANSDDQIEYSQVLQDVL